MFLCEESKTDHCRLFLNVLILFLGSVRSCPFHQERFVLQGCVGSDNLSLLGSSIVVYVYGWWDIDNGRQFHLYRVLFDYFNYLRKDVAPHAYCLGPLVIRGSGSETISTRKNLLIQIFASRDKAYLET